MAAVGGRGGAREPGSGGGNECVERIGVEGSVAARAPYPLKLWCDGARASELASWPGELCQRVRPKHLALCGARPHAPGSRPHTKATPWCNLYNL